MNHISITFIKMSESSKREIIQELIDTASTYLTIITNHLHRHVDEKQSWQFWDAIRGYNRQLRQFRRWYRNPPSNITTDQLHQVMWDLARNRPTFFSGGVIKKKKRSRTTNKPKRIKQTARIQCSNSGKPARKQTWVLNHRRIPKGS